MLKWWLECRTSFTGRGSDMMSSILVNVWAAVCAPTGYRSAVSWLLLSKTEMQSSYFWPKFEHIHDKLKRLVCLQQNIVLVHGGPYFTLWKHHNHCEETRSKAFKILCSGRSWFPYTPLDGRHSLQYRTIMHEFARSRNSPKSPGWSCFASSRIPGLFSAWWG